MKAKLFQPLHQRPVWLSVLCLLVGLLPTLLMAAPLQVFVSVLPQKHFAEQVGGAHVQVESMVQPGFSAETYEPTAQQVSNLAKAQVYVRVGMPFEDAWMQRIQAVNSTMQVIDAREGLPLLTLKHPHDHEAHDDEHGAHNNDAQASTHTDLHVWGSPRIAKQMAAQLRDVFSTLRPEQKTIFTSNYERFAAELDTLDAELTALFADKKGLKFMVYHPDWGYLADAYGLEQIPIETEGKEPGAKALTELIEAAKQHGVKTLLVQPQFSSKAAEQIAKAMGGNVVSIDPFSEDYIANLRKTARLLAGVE